MCRSFQSLAQTVLPSPQGQNMPNCVSEYAKFYFRAKNTWKLGSKFFHIFAKFTAQSMIHINTL